MLKQEILGIMTVDEWAGFLHYVEDKPKVYGTDEHNAPREEYATEDVHDYLYIKRGTKLADNRQTEANSGSVGTSTSALQIRSQVGTKQPEPSGSN